MINIIYRIFKRKKRVTILPLPPAGRCYDLQEIYDKLNSQYFESKLDLQISWFGKGIVPRTKILFGSYNHRTKSIRINRFLDQANIPQYVVRFIVYHEMLHCVLPPKTKLNGRRSIHHRGFKERERQFSEYALARDFIKNWIHKNAKGISEDFW